MLIFINRSTNYNYIFKKTRLKQKKRLKNASLNLLKNINFFYVNISPKNKDYFKKQDIKKNLKLFIKSGEVLTLVL